MWGRLRVVPFDVFIPEDDRDHQLSDKLAADADAVLAWAVAGWVDYTYNGLNEPDSVLVATDNYRIDSDAIGRFIDETCVTSPGVYSTTGELFKAWKPWADRRRATRDRGRRVRQSPRQPRLPPG